MVKEFKMSQERYDELKAELDYSKPPGPTRSPSLSRRPGASAT